MNALFGAVQATMIGWAVAGGRRPVAAQWAGVGLALAGLGWLTLPGAGAPDPIGTGLMALAGVAWGAYSLARRGAGDPVATNADNFLRCTPLAGALVLLLARDLHATAPAWRWRPPRGHRLGRGVQPVVRRPTGAQRHPRPHRFNSRCQCSPPAPPWSCSESRSRRGSPISAVAIVAGIGLTLRGREGSVR